MDNLKARGQEANNLGMPSLDLMDMQGVGVPSDFVFESVFGDIIMCEYIDENEHGEVWRDGVWIKQDVTRKLWRRAQVLLVGPSAANEDIKVGDQVAVPSDKGLTMVTSGKKKVIFVNKERLFGKLKPVAIPK